MRSYTVTKADPERFRVLPLIEKYGLDPTFVVHNYLQKRQLCDLKVPSSCIHISKAPIGFAGVSAQRNYTVKYVMPRGEWSLWLDDNVSAITGLVPALSRDKLNFEDGTDWRKTFEHELTAEEFVRHTEQTMFRADEAGTIMCGFALSPNFYFRGSKWQQHGYCRTQLVLYKNDGSPWLPGFIIEDLAKSIDVVCRYGSVLINRHVKPVKPVMFEKGGIGSFKERMPVLQANCKKLMELYPGLLKYQGDGKQYGLNEAENFHVTFAKRSQKTIDEWRKAHRYL